MPSQTKNVKKVSLWVAGGLATAGSLLATVAHGAGFTTSSLATAIDTVSGTTYDYFSVLITSFWPFLLGAVILVGVVVFGKNIVHRLFGK